ncbi:uroporphyrinogen-III synthase [Aestuariimicrobium ganziense]|uniref:uroporphyrinogen-III synthase n=1 Tax=Aestuariimicrobium ganziense TaxID=2773677 RepID=UPI002E2B8E29|nr:uroporphyrinogen-III synthase [Aestuariimicrobium ganziense]
MAEGLRAAGAEVVAEPLTRRVPVAASGTLDGADWVVLTSPFAVEALAGAGLAVPEGARVAAVGEATARAARDVGLAVSLVPDGESSARALAEAFPEGSGRVAIPGSALSSTVLADGLAAKGYAVSQFATYAVDPLDGAPAQLLAEWLDGHFDVVVITAGSIAAAVGSLLGWAPSASVVAFGPPSAAALGRLGVDVAATAATQDAPGVVAAIASLGKAPQ